MPSALITPVCLIRHDKGRVWDKEVWMPEVWVKEVWMPEVLVKEVWMPEVLVKEVWMPPRSS